LFRLLLPPLERFAAPDADASNGVLMTDDGRVRVGAGNCEPTAAI
jgi:hypothetical protein